MVVPLANQLAQIDQTKAAELLPFCMGSTNSWLHKVTLLWHANVKVLVHGASMEYGTTKRYKRARGTPIPYIVTSRS